METYIARVIDQIKNRPGTWQSIRIGIFRITNDTEDKVGEYVRDYPSPFSTFFPFTIDGCSYALYSPQYTVTRIMRLPSCEDIGGEERDQRGFCPVDYYIPSYVDREFLDASNVAYRYRITDPKPEDLLPSTQKWYPLDPQTGQRVETAKPTYPLGPLQYYPFGFVAGCMWGDDSSWKIQYLDLSHAAQGIIRREERFGYIALPDGITLKKAIRLSDYEYDSPDQRMVTIAIEKTFDLSTGNPVE